MPRSVATTQTVDLPGLLDFVRDRHHFVLATTRADGRPQVSPVSGGVDDQGRLVVSTYPGRAKALNVERNPRVSVCVLSDDFGGAWVQVDGDAEVLHMPEAEDAWWTTTGASPGSTRTGRSTAPRCASRASR